MAFGIGNMPFGNIPSGGLFGFNPFGTFGWGNTPNFPMPNMGSLTGALPSIANEIGGGGANTGVSNSNPDIQQIIIDVALKHGIPKEFLWIPIGLATGESDMDPNSVGDNGHSVGLFQLHDAGVGAGMGDSRYDPKINAEAIMDQIARAIQEGYQSGKRDYDLFEYVWFTAERPEDTPDARQHMKNTYKRVMGRDAVSTTGGKPTAGTDTGTGSGYTLPGEPNYDPYRILASFQDKLQPWVSTYLQLATGDRLARAEGAKGLFDQMQNAAQLKARTIPGQTHMPGFEPGGMLANFYKATGNQLPEMQAPQAPGWIDQLGSQPAEPLIQAMFPAPMDVTAMMQQAAQASQPYAWQLPEFLQGLPALAESAAHPPSVQYDANGVPIGTVP